MRGADRSLDLQPRGHATLRGTLQCGSALPEAVAVRVNLARDPASPQPWSKRMYGAFALNGSFEIENVEPGSYWVGVTPQFADGGYGNGTATVDVPEEGTVQVQIFVERRP